MRQGSRNERSKDAPANVISDCSRIGFIVLGWVWKYPTYRRIGSSGSNIYTRAVNTKTADSYPNSTNRHTSTTDANTRTADSNAYSRATNSYTHSADINPRATYTNASPTHRYTSVPAGPKPGHWEGKPSVSFTITEDGQISEFKLNTPLTAGGDCTIELKNVAIEDDAFVFSSLVEAKILNRFSPAELDFFRNINAACPYTPIKADSGEMIEAQNITGEFGSSDKVTGTFLIQVCEDVLLCEPGTWSAEWKEP